MEENVEKKELVMRSVEIKDPLMEPFFLKLEEEQWVVMELKSGKYPQPSTYHRNFESAVREIAKSRFLIEHSKGIFDSLRVFIDEYTAFFQKFIEAIKIPS